MYDFRIFFSGQYGVSFSPNNSNLYVSSGSRTTSAQHLDIILQYNLSLEYPSLIAASAKSVIVNNPQTNLPSNGILDGWSTVAKGMALALDGRLYISGNEPRDEIQENHILVVIDKPNEPGFGCRINYKRFDFADGKTGVGLPNFMQSYFNGIESSSTCSEVSAISLYPNPTNGLVNIDFLAGCNQSLNAEIFNSLGQHIFSFSSNTAGTVLDLSNFSSGVYFLVISTLYKNRIVKRVIKI